MAARSRYPRGMQGKQLLKWYRMQASSIRTASTAAKILCVLMAFCQPSLATDHFYFTYPDRASLLADGWDFLAHTVAGDARNTEQTTGAVVSYDQMAHPGVLRIPVDTGDLWGSANNTRKSLFRNLPSNCMSMRLKLSFAPTQNYQEAGLTVYQDDENYVQIIRGFSNRDQVLFNSERDGSPVTVVTTGLTQTALYLRLDRDVPTDTISAAYSVDGTNWTTLGSIIQHLINPRFAITSGGSPGGFPNADLSWAEIDQDPNHPPTYLNIYPAN